MDSLVTFWKETAPVKLSSLYYHRCYHLLSVQINNGRSFTDILKTPKKSLYSISAYYYTYMIRNTIKSSS